MVEEEVGPVQERIQRNWERLKQIEATGQDIVRLKDSLGKIEKVSATAPPEDLDRAMGKFEQYITRIEEKISRPIRRVITVSKPETNAENDDGPQDKPEIEKEEDKLSPPPDTEPDIPQEEIPQDPKTETEDGEIHEGQSPSEEPKEEVRPEEEVPVEEAPLEEKKDEEKPIEEPKEEVRPEEEVPVEEAPLEEKKDEEIPIEEPKEEVRPEEEVPVEEAPLEEKKDEEKPIEKPKEEVRPEEEVPVEKAPVEEDKPEEKIEDSFDPLPSVEEINTLQDEAKYLGGDTGPIQPHIKAMNDAVASNDKTLFEQYQKISKEWLEQYLIGLIPPSINNLISEIRSVESQYLELGKQDRLDGILPNIPGVMKNLSSKDIDVLRSQLDMIRESMVAIESDKNTLEEDLWNEFKDSIKNMNKMMERVLDDDKMDSFRDRIDEMTSVTQKEVLENFSKMRSLMKDISDEAASAERKKFEKILLSVEPLIQKVAEMNGDDSEEHKTLVREKDQLLSKFSTDINGAMEGMGELLDKSANMVAVIEENKAQNIEDSISEMKVRLEDFKGSLDTRPIDNILDKAEKLIHENELVKSQLLLEKAEAAFDKLKDISIKAQARSNLDNVKKMIEELISLKIDVSPLDELLNEVETALDAGELIKFEEKLEIIEGRIQLMKREELKVEYQKLLMTIMNEIKELRNNDIETDKFEEALEKVKELSLSRDLEGSVKLEKDLLKDVRKSRLSKIITERLASSRETLNEAQGLLIETDSAKEKMVEAQRLHDEGKFEESLELMTIAQVELEERMTTRTFSMIEDEIRKIWAETEKYSIEVGDIEPSIQEAYNLADDEKFKEAMEHLYGLKETLSRQLNSKKAGVLLEELGNMIKKARSVGLKIATFKAAHTKAKVLLDAGDIASVIDLVERQIKSLDERIINRKELQSTLDELRGRLIGSESKVQKMVDKGLSVSVIRQRMNAIKELIDTADVEQAKKEIDELEDSINDEMNMGQANTETKAIEDKVETVAYDTPKEPVPSPEESKGKLYSLVAEINQEMKARITKGEETSAIKKDIETIQNLVIGKDYLKAYQVARSCLERISD